MFIVSAALALVGALLEPHDDNRFTIAVEGSGVDLTALKSQTTESITIGNNTGTTTTSAREKGEGEKEDRREDFESRPARNP